MLRAVGLDVGVWRRWRRLSIGGWRRRERSLHLDTAFAHDEVIDGAIASFKVRLQAQALGQQHTNRVPLLQPDLVIGDLGEPGVGSFVRASLDVVERVGSPVRRVDNGSIEAVSNLEKGLDWKVLGFETAGVWRAGDGYVEIGVRRRRKPDGGNVKGQCGRVVGFFHDGGLRVKARAGQEDEKGREQTDRSLNDAGHGVRLLVEMIRANERPSSR